MDIMGRERRIMTQNERVYKLLKENGDKGVTNVDAEKFGVTRLPARIFELRRMGFDIQVVHEDNHGMKSVKYVFVDKIDKG